MLPGKSPGSEDRKRLAAQPAYDARHVDPAAAGIAPGRLASQLSFRRHLLRRGRDVDGRVQGQGDDGGHESSCGQPADGEDRLP